MPRIGRTTAVHSTRESLSVSYRCHWPGGSERGSLEMRKNSPLIILPFIAVVGLVAFCWIALSSRASGPILLGLQSYTNASAVVGITNGSVHQFHYEVMVERKIGGEWPKGLRPGTIVPQHQCGSLCPAQSTNLTIPIMVYAPPYPWRVSVFCNREAPVQPNYVQPNSLRYKTGFLALRLGMRKLAHELFGPNFKQIQVSTQEMQQWER